MLCCAAAALPRRSLGQCFIGPGPDDQSLTLSPAAADTTVAVNISSKRLRASTEAFSRAVRQASLDRPVQDRSRQAAHHTSR
jgi:hypothetical protein